MGNICEDFDIRLATEADLPAIVNIYNESIPAGRSTADTRPVAVEDRIEWFRKFDPVKRPIWVAETSGQVIGVCSPDHSGAGSGSLALIPAAPRGWLLDGLRPGSAPSAGSG